MNKTILITGSTDGIGKLAAIKLAKEGHQIGVHGRNEEKVANVVSTIKTLSNNENITGFIADFSDLTAVKQMAADVKSKFLKIDILMNNAGVLKSPVTQTQYGDIRLVVNYLAPVLLTSKLLPLFRKGTEARIVNLSSAAQSPVSLSAFQSKAMLEANSAYAQSKLALTMWSFHLAKELNDVSVLAVNPGSLLNTKMVSEAYGKHWSPAEKGGNILYDLAISDKYKGETGKYFDNDKGDPVGEFASAHAEAYNEQAIEKLMQVTNEILADIT